MKIWTLVVEGGETLDVTVHLSKPAAYTHLRKGWPIGRETRALIGTGEISEEIDDDDYNDVLERDYEVSSYIEFHEIDIPAPASAGTAD